MEFTVNRHCFLSTLFPGVTGRELRLKDSRVTVAIAHSELRFAYEIGNSSVLKRVYFPQVSECETTLFGSTPSEEIEKLRQAFGEEVFDLEISLVDGFLKIKPSTGEVSGAEIKLSPEKVSKFAIANLEGETAFFLNAEEVKVLASAAEIAAQNLHYPFPQVGSKGDPLVDFFIDQGCAAIRVRAKSATQSCNLNFYPIIFAQEDAQFSISPESLMIASSWGCDVEFLFKPEESLLVISSSDLTKTVTTLFSESNFEEVTFPDLDVHQESTGISGVQIREYLARSVFAWTPKAEWEGNNRHVCGLGITSKGVHYMTFPSKKGGTGCFKSLDPNWKNWEKTKFKYTWLNGIYLEKLLEWMPDSLTLEFLQDLPGVKLSSLCHSWIILGIEENEEFPPQPSRVIHVDGAEREIIYAEVDSCFYDRSSPREVLIRAYSPEPQQNGVERFLFALGSGRSYVFLSFALAYLSSLKAGSDLVYKKAKNNHKLDDDKKQKLEDSKNDIDDVFPMFKELVEITQDFSAKNVLEYLRGQQKFSDSPEKIKQAVILAGIVRCRTQKYPVVSQYCFSVAEHTKQRGYE
jgi:hypothetical protein